MIIEKGTSLEVTFYGICQEDIDSSTLMEWLFDNVPNIKVVNPSYREIRKASDENLEENI